MKKRTRGRTKKRMKKGMNKRTRRGMKKRMKRGTKKRKQKKECVIDMNLMRKRQWGKTIIMMIIPFLKERWLHFNS